MTSPATAADRAVSALEAGLAPTLALSLARTGEAFHHADAMWQAALVKRFGTVRRAADARYSAAGRGEPGCPLRAAYDARHDAYAAWCVARGLPVSPAY